MNDVGSRGAQRSDSPEGVEVRPFVIEDGERTLRIFERAIQITARSRYSAREVAAWLGPSRDPATWSADRLAAGTFVADISGAVVGFTDLSADGYVDRLFVDPDHGRRGIAAALLDHVRRLAVDRGIAELSTHASLVARPVFENAGFQVSYEEAVEKEGEVLRRFFMTSRL
jgi:putative acetyltransferase